MVWKGAKGRIYKCFIRHINKRQGKQHKCRATFSHACFSRCGYFYQDSIGEDAKGIFFFSCRLICISRENRAQTTSVITSGEAHLFHVTEHGPCERKRGEERKGEGRNAILT